MSWLPWLLAASIPVLAVALRLLAGEDSPDNTITQEQGEDTDDPGPAAVPVAA